MSIDSDIATRIRTVLIDALSLNLREEDLQYSGKLDELVGLDSLAALEFVAAIEKEFGITFGPEGLELQILRDLPRLAEYIAARTGLNTTRGALADPWTRRHPG